MRPVQFTGITKVQLTGFRPGATIGEIGSKKYYTALGKQDEAVTAEVQTLQAKYGEQHPIVTFQPEREAAKVIVDGDDATQLKQDVIERQEQYEALLRRTGGNRDKKMDLWSLIRKHQWQSLTPSQLHESRELPFEEGQDTYSIDAFHQLAERQVQTVYSKKATRIIDIQI